MGNIIFLKISLNDVQLLPVMTNAWKLQHYQFYGKVLSMSATIYWNHSKDISICFYSI